ncbi:DE-cadherin isoform X2 [Nasonia vitripennis]|uniref:DE-cadherin n=1 Tax=Nasonia vitripennis TaxID=7425 RepID=A0A7M7G524_NASVI|nr:DE-cadherin isoform X2 [Nasonia vitripennis]
MASWPQQARLCLWARPRTMSVQGLALLMLLCAGTLADTTKLRHAKHLDLRSQLRSEDDLLMKLRENHNHKPVFTNCSRLVAKVPEESMPNTKVLTVHAEDRDPPEDGGTITYSFVTTTGEKLKFKIDNTTGEITTTHMLDRDEPAREKEIYLTVLATDNGRPQLDDVCTFKVTVTDINDNAPVFDKVSYTESVPQDLSIGREVMRVSATDIDDGVNSVVRYKVKSLKNPEDVTYFRIDFNTGVIFLNKTIDKGPGYKFSLTAMAYDQGIPQSKYNEIDLDIRVVESHKKAPTFSYTPTEPIMLKENFSDYEASIARLEAQSNIEDSDYFLFELVTGRTEQANKENTFRLESNKNVAHIKLAKALDYESNTEYSLIVRVQNKYQLGAETMIYIQVLDVNDNIPVFREIKKGSVLENEPPGTPVMQVRAIDADGTAAHNQVTYALGNYQDLFDIDEYTGNITTRVTFDRETEYTYTVKVIATDNSPSALFSSGVHNKGEQNFRIEIADKNDNPPHFTQREYKANSIPEDANINSLVTEVKALDADTASPVTYSILYGNVDDSFYIENTTGKIRVNQNLDYEKITQYNLTVRAFDGIYDDTATVRIYIENVNDNQPVFEAFDKNPVIEEEKLVDGCITNVVAYDPDIKDRSADQHIVYSILRPEHQPLIEINKDGCMKLKKPLDRDPPHGYPVWTIIVIAQDEDGGQNSLRNVEAVNITLTDINDNAPFLDMPYPVIWDENQDPGNITELKARDYDSDENGPPFTYKIDIDLADSTILSNFEIRGKDLYAKVRFDREERKSYDIPVAITDNGSPPLTGTSKLTVIIGDKNDNEMMDGSSSIFVYNYNGESPQVDIGRVYVTDPDDWDLNDKTFSWSGEDPDYFNLNKTTGMITMLPGIGNGTFLLKFTVMEEGAIIKKHYAYATVNVTVKEIPKEAVVKSGSIRFLGISAEELIAPGDLGISKKDILQERLSSMFNVSVENVDVFTVLHSPHHNKSVLDVRFSAHGSPYYAPEKLNTIVVTQSEMIEREMGADVLLVNIDECLMEKVHCNESCRSFLNINNTPSVVYTNTSSFVGVRAVVDPQCICHVAEPIDCLNGGTPLGARCECPPGLEGPRCELLAVGFHGDGYAIMPSPGQACDDSYLGLELTAHTKDALVFYFGPMRYTDKLDLQDFMSLELQDGNPVLYVDYGQGSIMLDKAENSDGRKNKLFLADGKPHRIDIYWTKTSIEMKVDNCGLSSCMRLKAPVGTREFLNVNGQFQIGGSLNNLAKLGDQFKWQHVPTEQRFVGCIRNMTMNGNTFNLGMPSLSLNADPGCSTGMAKAVSFGIDTNFLVAILVCIAILLILLLAVVVHRRKTDDLYKDMDDIRENIINYEDEGGGEVDTGYDLNVLRSIYDPPNDMKINAVSLGREPDEVPDICGFLDGKKECCDKDPDTNPFDDVRHYAYEGEGNSDGSLSSLASCTDDGDLKFNYLSNFGPRFRKLADMYGEEPSDEESEGVGDRESESWC